MAFNNWGLNGRQISPRINKKMITNKWEFIGTFSFYTFEPTFRMIFPPFSEFKRSMKKAYHNFPSFEPWRWREDHPKCRFKCIKRKGFIIFSFVENYLFIYPWISFHPILTSISIFLVCLQEKTLKLLLIFFHARISALIDISLQFGVSSGFNRYWLRKI